MSPGFGFIYFAQSSACNALVRLACKQRGRLGVSQLVFSPSNRRVDKKKKKKTHQGEFNSHLHQNRCVLLGAKQELRVKSALGSSSTGQVSSRALQTQQSSQSKAAGRTPRCRTTEPWPLSHQLHAGVACDPPHLPFLQLEAASSHGEQHLLQLVSLSRVK